MVEKWYGREMVWWAAGAAAGKVNNFFPFCKLLSVGAPHTQRNSVTIVNGRSRSVPRFSGGSPVLVSFAGSSGGGLHSFPPPPPAAHQPNKIAPARLHWQLLQRQRLVSQWRTSGFIAQQQRRLRRHQQATADLHGGQWLAPAAVRVE